MRPSHRSNSGRSLFEHPSKQPKVKSRPAAEFQRSPSPHTIRSGIVIPGRKAVACQVDLASRIGKDNSRTGVDGGGNY